MKTLAEMPKPNLKVITNEKWRSIPKTNGKYEVSNYGRVKSYCYDSLNGKIVKAGNIKGYKSVNLRIEGKKRTLLVHKIVAELFIPKERETQDVVIHKDWNKQNNRIDNLEWKSREESFLRAQSKLIKARKDKGKIITHSKLTLSDVSAIKRMLSLGRKQKVIAELFCVSEMQISRIKHNVSWADV